MESQLKEKRGSTIKFITLGTLVALSSTLTGCSTTPTTIAQKDKDKDKEESQSSSAHYSGGHGVRSRMPFATSSTPKPSGTVSRGWFGGFRFCGG